MVGAAGSMALSRKQRTGPVPPCFLPLPFVWSPRLSRVPATLLQDKSPRTGTCSGNSIGTSKGMSLGDSKSGEVAVKINCWGLKNDTSWGEKDNRTKSKCNLFLKKIHRVVVAF